MALLKSDLKTCFQKLEVRDFKLKNEVGGYVFTKLNKETGDRYGIIIPYEKAIDGYYLYCPMASIYFKEIEEMLVPLYSKYELFTREMSETLCDSFLNLSNFDKAYFGIHNEVKSIEEFDAPKLEMQRGINNYSLPFIDKYSNIENVAEFIDNLETDKVWRCVNSQGSAYIRAALILKVAKHHSFENKLIEYYKFYKEIYNNNLLKYGEHHHITERTYKTINAMNEFFFSDFESIGYRN